MTESAMQQVLAALRGKRFDLHNEKALQQQLADALNAAGLPWQREVRLSEASIIDFMVGTIGIEVKIKGAPKSIYEQCQRYCAFPEIQQLLLLTNKQLALPASLDGKPTRTLNLGLAWL